MIHAPPASLFHQILKEVSTPEDSLSPGILWLPTGDRCSYMPLIIVGDT